MIYFPFFLIPPNYATTGGGSIDSDIPAEQLKLLNDMPKMQGLRLNFEKDIGGLSKGWMLLIAKTQITSQPANIAFIESLTTQRRHVHGRQNFTKTLQKIHLALLRD